MTASPTSPTGFTYEEVGATRDPRSLPPPGHHVLRYRIRLGAGPGVLEAAGEALAGWGMHRAAGLRVARGTPRAAPGVAVVLGMGIGPLLVRAPCRASGARWGYPQAEGSGGWVVREPGRTGFAYGTLPGHPERGEESFVAVAEADGSVWLEVTAFSRPAVWYTRAAGPLARAAQHLMARRYGRG